MTAQRILLSEADVAQVMSLPDALEALEAGLRAQGQGQATTIPKALGRFGDGGAMHCLGATWADAGYVGWKTWAITPRGGGVIYELFDAGTGSLVALIEGGGLGQLRTAAMTGLGTRWLAAPDADTLAIVGAGRQALGQVAAIAAVRPLKSVKVFSRDPSRCEAFASLLSDTLGLDAEAAPTLEAAVGDAAITTLVTRAETPFLKAEMLPAGAHLNAVGAILPTHAEFFDDVFDRVTRIAVDSPSDVLKASREFVDRFAGDGSTIAPLSDLVAAGVPPTATDGLTLFKSMGMGLSDLSVAIEIHRRAVAAGLGQPVGLGTPSKIRWA